MDVTLCELQELVIDREAWRAAIHGVTKSQTRLSDWTELNWLLPSFSFISSLIFKISFLLLTLFFVVVVVLLLLLPVLLCIELGYLFNICFATWSGNILLWIPIWELLLLHPIGLERKNIEENGRMGMTRYLFKKVRDIKGTWHTKMVKIRTEMARTE